MYVAAEERYGVDLTRAARLSKADTRVMMEATEEHFAHDDVTVLQLDAPESRRWAHMV
jgi:hypothetical protein